MIRVMRSSGPGVALLMIAIVVLAGCTSGTDGDPAGDERHVPGGEGCPGSDPAQPLPPDQHEVERTEDLQCAGQYLILAEGSGATMEVPAWDTGDNWSYQIVRFTPEPVCEQEYTETIAGNGTSWDKGVYGIEMQSFLDCERTEHPAGPSTSNRTKDTLSILHDSGYVHREAMFPLTDGKRWAFVNSVGDFVEATVHHEPDYGFNETPHEAWRVELDRAGGSVVHQWWGEEAGTMLREHRWLEDTLFNGRVLDRYERAR